MRPAFQKLARSLQPPLKVASSIIRSLRGEGDRKRIAVMRCDELGDLLLWLPAARRLRRAFPESQWEITLIGKPSSQDLNKRCNYWNRSFGTDLGISPRKAPSLASLFLELAKADILINPMPDLSRAHFAIFSSAGRRLCLDSGPEGFIHRRREEIDWHNSLFTELLKVSPGEHMLDINDRIVDAIAGPGAGGESTLDKILDFMPDREPGMSNYLLIAPGGGDPRKRWETGKFAAFANALSRHFEKIAICGTSAEAPLAAAIIAGLDEKGKAIDLCGRTDIADLSGLLRHAALFIGNDSSASHFAALHGTPGICILGYGHHGSFQPYPERFAKDVKMKCLSSRKKCVRCNWRCELAPEGNAPFPCISEVSVEAAIEAANGLRY